MVDILVTPKQYGAVGDGVANDTAAVQAAFNSGLPVFLDGLFSITSPITVNLNTTNKGLFVMGGGRAQSQIIFNAPNLYIRVNIADVGNPFGSPYAGQTQAVTLKDFTVVPNSTSTEPALWFVAPAKSGSSEPLFNISGVHVIPANTSSYNKWGFHLSNMRNGTVSDCIIIGKYFDNTPTVGGIELFGSPSPRSNPVDLHIRDCQIHHYLCGISLAASGQTDRNNPSDWQGVYINNSTFLACDRGVQAQTSDFFSALLEVRGCHFNTNLYGIHAENIWHPVFNDNNFIFGGTAGAVVGIQHGGHNQHHALGGHICNNYFYFARPTQITAATAIVTGSDGSPNGGCFTNISNNTAERAGASGVSLIGSFGGTVYGSGNNIL